MKVIFCKRYTHSGFHIHAGSYAEMFYVPELKCAFGREQMGTFGSYDEFVSETDYIIKEGQDLDINIIPNTDGASFEDIQVLDLDFDYITELIDKLKYVKSLQKSNKNEIEKLIDEYK